METDEEDEVAEGIEDNYWYHY